MSTVIETKIDERSRSGSLTGLAKPGERYQVERVSPVELRMRLLLPATMPRPKVARRAGLTVLSSGRKLTQQDVADALADFP